MADFFISFALILAIGLALGIGETKVKHDSAKVALWVLAFLLLVVAGVIF
jgi:hypothetical protein